MSTLLLATAWTPPQPFLYNWVTNVKVVFPVMFTLLLVTALIPPPCAAAWVTNEGDIPTDVYIGLCMDTTTMVSWVSNQSSVLTDVHFGIGPCTDTSANPSWVTNESGIATDIHALPPPPSVAELPMKVVFSLMSTLLMETQGLQQYEGGVPTDDRTAIVLCTDSTTTAG